MTSVNTFRGDLVSYLRARRERQGVHALAAQRINQRDVLARDLARKLSRPSNAGHVNAIAVAFGVPRAHLRAAIANELARCRVREQEARAAVREVTP